MRRFNFPLQKVMDLRSHVEQDAKIELGRAVSELNRLEEELRGLAVERVRASSERYAPPATTASIRYVDLYILRLDQKKEALLKDIATAELRVEECRKRYTLARAEHKVLEKLKEKKKKEYHKEEEKEETRVLDDITGGARAREQV